MKRIITALFFIVISSVAIQAQTLLLTEDFENDGNGTDYRANVFDDSGSDVFTRSDNSNNGPNNNTEAVYSGYQGNDWWCGEDIDASDNPFGIGTDGYITLKTLDISSYQNGMVEVRIYLAGNDNTAHRYETDDFIQLKYAFDTDISTGANTAGNVPTQANLTTGTYTTFAAWYGAGDGITTTTSSALRRDTDLNGSGDLHADSLGNVFKQFTIQFNVGASNSLVSIQVHAATSAGSEEVGIDHIQVYGITGSSPVAVSITNNTAVSCNGGNDGSLTATATSGTTPYTYLWSNSGTSATISSLAAGTYTITVTDNAGSTATASAFVSQPSAVSATATATSTVSCNGLSDGVATGTASGGTTPYTYSWSNGITVASNTGLTAGTYTVTVTDANGCTDADAVFISQPSAVSATATATSTVSCNGLSDGVATGTASGGTTPYTYTWSNGITVASNTGLAAGTYTVTVTDANGCTDTDAVFIAQPTAVSATATATQNVTTNGGSDGIATGSASGGTGAYTYLWSNAATTATNSGLVAGTYTVTVTDANGCTDTDAVSITQPAAAVVVSITGQTNVSCNGLSDGSLTATATSGTTPYTYLWSNSATSATNTGLVTGTYTITVTDNAGSTATTSAFVSQPTAISATATATSTVSCNGGSDGVVTGSASGGTGAYTYAWSNGATVASNTGLPAGTYTLTVTDANGCTGTDAVAIAQPTAVSATATATSSVSCNGLSDGVATGSASGGTAPYTYSWSNGTTVASNTGLAAGTYTVTVTDGNGCTDTDITTINEPTALVSVAAATQNITTNGGSDGIATGSASGGTVPYTYAWSNGATVASNTGLVAGTYSVTVTDANGCTDSASTTLTEPMVATVYSLPYSENFDNIAFDNTSFGPGSEPFPVATNGLFINDWQNDQADAANQDWYGRSTSTGSSNTGPTSDHTGGGRYIFVEDGFGNNSDINLESPLIDLVGITSAEIAYWAHSRTTSTSSNEMRVDIYHNNAWVLNIDSFGQLSTTDTWFERKIDISAYVGDTIKFRFRGDNSTTSFQHDIAIDDVSVIETVFGASLDSVSTQIQCFGETTGYLRALANYGTTPYSYNWSTGDTSAAIGNLLAGIYTVTVSDSAGSTVVLRDTVENINSNLFTSLTATQPSCFGGSDGQIVIDSISGAVPFSTALVCGDGSAFSCAGSSTTDTLGTGTSTNGTTSYPAIYGNWYWGAKHQILYRASELNAKGITGTTLINSLSWDVAQINGTSNYSNFTIKMACTPDTVADSWKTGLTTVLSPSSHTVSTGWNTHTFDTPFLWDGMSNIVIEVCFNNSGFTNNSATRYTSSGFTSVRYYRADISTVCSNTTSTTGTSSNRPNILIGHCAPSPPSPYNYLWSNGATTDTISGLVAGTYTLTVTDAIGCMFVDTISISDPAPTSASITSTDISCNGLSDGTMTASITGGTPPYSYNWTTGDTTAVISGLSVGSYTVTITDNAGCISTGTDSINEPLTLVSTVAVDSTVSCNGGSDGGATASASGGTSPYSYLWSNSASTASITGVVAGTYTVTVTDGNGCTDTDNVTITEPTAVNGTITASTNVSCNGGSDGSATASASGGTGAYTYLWSNAATTAINSSLAAGTYTVTVTDANGCTDTDNVTITEPTAVSATIAIPTNVSCNGGSDGSATASASGGTGAYTYAWSNGGTSALNSSLTAGTYTVTVTDANGCTDTDNVTITEPTAVSATIAIPTNVSCNGGSDGSATASASGGTGAYTYAWSNAATTATNSSLTAGTYTVTVTDANGCTDTDNVTITEPTAVSATIAIPTNVSCNGGSDGSATASASGGTGAYTYAWSNAAITATNGGLIAGTYTVTVTDANGCTDTDNVTVTEPALLVTTSVVDSNVTCNGGSNGGVSATTVGGTMPYTYTWSTGVTTTRITNAAAGTYTVTVTDNNGCTDTSSSIVSEPTTLIVTNVFTDASCNGGNDGTATAIANGGTPPYTYNWSTGSSTATTANLGVGTYTATVTDANGCFDTTSATISQPTALVVSVQIDGSIICNGDTTGGASVTMISGGTTPYNINWSNGSTDSSITNLSAGTYTVSVTDGNGCVYSDSVIISQPTAVAISLSVDSAINCFGDSTGVVGSIVSGGTGAYQYQWSNGDTTSSIVGISTGTYILVVRDSNGCVGTDSIFVSEPVEIITNLSDTACESYTWPQNGMTYTMSGVYDDVVTASNGCDSTIRLTLTILSASGSTETQTACFFYTWPQNNMTYTQSGIYTDTLFGANSVGCDSVLSLDLTIMRADVSIIRNGLDLIALANGGNATFQWLDCGNGDTVITGADSNIFTIPKNGFYSVVVTQNGCTDTSICINVVNIGLDENRISDALNVYPNPTRGKVIFELEGIYSDFEILQIYDLSGNLIKEVQIQSNREEIDVSNFADGIYLLRYGGVYKKLIVTE